MPKEALHVLIGVTKAGKKEVIDYALFPPKSIFAYFTKQKRRLDFTLITFAIYPILLLYLFQFFN